MQNLNIRDCSAEFENSRRVDFNVFVNLISYLPFTFKTPDLPASVDQINAISNLALAVGYFANCLLWRLITWNQKVLKNTYFRIDNTFLTYRKTVFNIPSSLGSRNSWQMDYS